MRMRHVAGGRVHGGSGGGGEPGRRASRWRCVHGVRPDALSAGRRGDRRGIRLSAEAAAGTPRPRSVLRLPRDDQPVVPPGGAAHPGGSDPCRDVRDRAEPPEMVRAHGFVHGPDVAGDGYSVAMCNDPCTVQGFNEPIIGYISIVQTAREATLLTQNQRLFNRIYALAPRREETGQGVRGAGRAVRCARPGALVDGEPDERDGGSARRRVGGGDQRPRACAETSARAHDRDRLGARPVRTLGVDPQPEATSRISTRPSGNPPGAAPPRATT